MCDVRCARRYNGGWRERPCGGVPFEFICEIARARALAEAGHVEGGAAAARHVDVGGGGGGGGERGDVMAVGGECGGRGGRRCWWRESGTADGRIKTEVDGRKELLACCKRNRLQSLARQGPRLLKSRAHCRHPRAPCYLLHARVVNGAGRGFRAVRSHSPTVSTRKQSSCAAAQPIGTIDHHIFQHDCDQPLLLRAF